MAHDERVAIAASNNADLYQAMFEAWDLRYEREHFAFIGRDRPPPYYSHLTILRPNCVDEVISRLRTAARRHEGNVGFKDSFSEFRSDTFKELFTASWIWRAPEACRSPEGWAEVVDRRELSKWEVAWKQSGSPTEAHMFREPMLERSDIHFWGKVEAGTYVSGCIANRSSGCVGVSNIFSRGAADVFHEATQAAACAYPDLPIVGYATGSSLKAALACGHEQVGNLRVLTTDGPAF